MRSLTLLPLALLLPALPGAPQTGAALSPALEQVPPSLNCPVSFSATHQRTGDTVEVGRADRGKESAPAVRKRSQAFDVVLQSLLARHIVEASGELHGLNGPQMLPLAGKPRADATEPFHLLPAAAPSPTFQSVVYAEQLTGVRWIDLQEITFADGTHWHASATSVCRAAPGGLLLVADRP